MEWKKIKIFDSMTREFVIILTDAPLEAVKEWIKAYKEGLEEGRQEYDFSSLEKKYYVKVLCDSLKEDAGNPDSLADAIGFTESYDIYAQEIKSSFEVGRRNLLRAMKEALKERNYTILDSDSTSITVKNKGIGPDFFIKVKKD